MLTAPKDPPRLVAVACLLALVLGVVAVTVMLNRFVEPDSSPAHHEVLHPSTADLNPAPSSAASSEEEAPATRQPAEHPGSSGIEPPSPAERSLGRLWLEIEVLDQNQEPLENANVELTSVVDIQREDWRQTRSTSARGLVRFLPERNPEYQVRVTAHGAEVHRRISEANRVHRILLPRATIPCQVVNQFGEGVSAALVSVIAPSSTCLRYDTDGHGHCSIPFVPGSLLLASKNRVASNALTLTQPPAGPVILQLGTPVLVEGRVVLDDGSRADGSVLDLSEPIQSSKLAEDGTYSFRTSRNNGGILRFRIAQCPTVLAAIPWDRYPESTHLDLGVLRVRPFPRLTVTVSDARTGQLLQGVDVRVSGNVEAGAYDRLIDFGGLHPSPAGEFPDEHFGRTDARGSFECGVYPLVRYEVLTTGLAMARTETHLSMGEASTEHHVSLQPAGGVRASILGCRAEAARVVLTSESTKERCIARENSDGLYVAMDLEPGAYVLHFTSSSALPEKRQVTVSPGKVSSETIVAREGMLLTGVVLDSHGEPMRSGLSVTAAAPVAQQTYSTRTDENGAFALASVPATEKVYLIATRVTSKGTVESTPRVDVHGPGTYTLQFERDQ